MADRAAPPEIALLLYPRAQLAAIHGLTDLFSIADTLARKRLGESEPLLHVSHLGRAEEDGKIIRIFDTCPNICPGIENNPDIIILPPSLGDPPCGENVLRWARWLQDRHAHGAVLASVCAGAFLLAETGLLKGRAATTHWTYAEMLAERFPDIHVDSGKLIIDDGDIITAGGLMSWTDLGLKLVDRLLGPTAMIETARFLLLDPPGREQRYYSVFSPRLAHGDEAMLKVQHWLQRGVKRNLSIADMASYAGLEERTFLRRFRKATGLKPTEYCQHLRVGKAREMLEASSRPIDQIAWEVGYEDASSFHKVFIKVTGLTPGQYRRRFRAEGCLESEQET